MPKQSNKSRRPAGPLDSVREWISDNLRYLILGFGALIALIILVLVIRALTGGSQKTGGTGAAAQQGTAVRETGAESAGRETDESVQPGQDLTENDPDVLDVITRYYTAWAAKDMETMRAVNPNLSAEDETDILKNEAIEGFENITVYSAPGMTDDSRVAFVCFDVKVAGINTLAPTLTDYYLENSSGQGYQISDKFMTQERTDFMEKLRASSGVQALIRMVNQKLQQAASQDADLKEYVVSLQGGASADDGEEAADSDGFSVGDEVSATTDINVRSEASTNGVLYGMLSRDHQAQILEVRDDGWCKIRYTTGGTTIEGYVMAQYLSRTGS